MCAGAFPVSPLRFRLTEQTSMSVEVHLGVQPPDWSKTMCACFPSILFTSFVSPPLVSLNGMVSFQQIWNHLQSYISVLRVFILSVLWLRLGCMRLYCTGSHVGECGSVLWQSWSFFVNLQWWVLFREIEVLEQFFSQVVQNSNKYIWNCMGVYWQWVQLPLVDWGKKNAIGGTV